MLVLQSSGPGAEPFQRIADEFRAALAAGSPVPVDLQEISLEAALGPEGRDEDLLVRYLASLDAQRRFGLVVSIGGPAARFVQRHRGQVFSATPMLFAGADRRHLQAEALTPADSAVAIQLDLGGAFAGMLQLFPEADEVVVVLGASPNERFWAQEIKREFEPLADRARLTFWNDLPFEAMLDRAAALPPRTLVFYGLYVVDAGGVPHPNDGALAALHGAASAPVFGLFEEQLGRGIVGGSLVSLRQVGQETAAAAVRLLAGESPSLVRPLPILPGAPVFDGRELERFQVPAERLPAGSVVRFREPSLWQAHRGKILAIAAVGAVQATLILALSLALIGRRRAVRALRASEERYALAVDGTSDGLWDWDLRSGELKLTPRARALLGLPDGVAGDRFADWEAQIDPGDREAVRDALRAHCDGQTPDFRAEFRVLRAGGAPSVLLARGKAQRDGAGRAVRLAGALSDVTERRLAEDAVRDLSRRLIVAQEEERARLARELHDDLTQRLARLAIDVGRAEQRRNEVGVEATLHRVREGLVGLSEGIRELSYRLHPSLLEHLGLADALQVECERFTERTGIPAHLALGPLPTTIPRSVALCLFRVAQEALTNVARHARADTLEVRLLALEDGLQLAVRDDGVGFEPAGPGRRHGLGHASMRERVLLARGELDIESAPGQGTTVIAWVPLQEEEAT